MNFFTLLYIYIFFYNLYKTQKKIIINGYLVKKKSELWISLKTKNSINDIIVTIIQ